jgi:hypothetical protein
MDRRHRYALPGLTVIVGAALIPLLAACGGSSSSSSSGTATTSTATTSSSTSTSASLAACRAAGLAVNLDTSGNGAAGSVYYTLKFTNTSGGQCTVGGYPGISAINGSGAQLGSPASRNATTSATTVTLAPGQTATATLQIVNAGNFSASTCGPTSATGLRIYAPNQTTPSQVAFSFQACSKSGPTYLTIGPLVATGSSGGGGGGGGATMTACKTSGLSVHLSMSGSGAAGSIYYPLMFTNTSGTTCTITGYPGVSAIGSSGAQLGSAAGRNPSTPTTTVTLANGHSATAQLQVAEVGNYTASACAPTSAAALRVYPPNQTQSTTVAFTGSVCSKAGPVYLHVTAVK